MTTKRTFVAGVAVVALLVGSPALAGYKLMPKDTVQRFGKLGRLVILPNDWNRLGAKIGRNAESWTLDGLSLNDMTLYAEIKEGPTLFREADKKN